MVMGLLDRKRAGNDKRKSFCFESILRNFPESGNYF